MRILHVIPGLAPHGAETVLYRLVTSPSDMEHEVVCLAGRDFYSPRLEERGIRVHHLDMSSPLGLLKGLPRLNRLIRANRADVVQCWMYRSNVMAGVLGRFAGIPVVWNVRCSSLEPLPFGSRLLVYAGGAIAGWVPTAIVNCSANSAKLHERLGYDSAKGAVIPNGYDPAALGPDEESRAAVREALDIDPDIFLIGSIGRWHPMKGFAHLLKAIAAVRAKGLPVRLALIGRGLDAGNRELANLIRDSGCEGAVMTLGERADVDALARALDLHVLASIGSEGFPNVVAETMLSGTPNLVTDVGDSALIVGDTGWVVQPAEPAELTNAIEQALDEHRSSPEQWERRRQLARRHISENFSLESMARAYERVWKQAVEASRAGENERAGT